MGKKERLKLVVIILILAVGISLFWGVGKAFALAAGNSTAANLTIYDDTDTVAGSLIRLSGQQITFFANFTNFTGSVINVTEFAGNCSITFNTTGSYTPAVNMTYNASSLLWRYNTTFSYKGTNSFRVICNSSQGNITLNDTFLITNTAPTISTTSGGSFVDIDGNVGTNDYWQCTEDIFCPYNFSANVTEPDTNDVLTYDYATNANTTLTNFTLNSSSGILSINVTNDASVGSKQIELNVRDTESPAISRILRVNITAVNDIPRIINLTSEQMNMTVIYNKIYQAVDEENSVPFNLTLNFTACNVAEWSTRGTNCTLFTENEYTFNVTTGILNVTFTPSRNDVGNYTLNFTLKDSQNGTNSTLVNFSILNINVPPHFRYTCDNAREATENSAFTCIVNASDVDETNNLTIRATVNGSTQWFIFNATQTSMLTQRVNATTEFNATFLVNFTVGDVAVGNWSVNLTVNDTGLPGQANSTTFYFYVANTPDGVSLQNLTTVNTFTSNNYTLFIDGYDDDLLIQDKNAFNEVLTFYSNDSRVFVQRVNATGNKSTARIVFNGSNFTNAVHYVNVTVNDSTQRTNSTLLILNFSSNTPPAWVSQVQTAFNLTEGTAFTLNLTANVTDSDSDVITFANLSNNSFPNFALDTVTGVISFTPADNDVGLHTVTINATDGKTPTPLNFTFAVYNLNESPRIVKPFTAGDNVTITSTSNITATEDSRANFVVLIDDEDFKIPTAQRSFHNENLTLNLTISGPNPSLFSLVFNSILSSPNNRSQYDVAFTPNKSDTGNYNVTLNVSDISGLSDFIQFNISITAINHSPNLTAISNKTSYVNASFSLDMNATDIEDGTDNGNLTYNITFLQGTDFVGNNATIFNITTGLLNITFNNTHPGLYRLNVTVNDSTQLRVSRDFFLTVYGVPEILTPAGSVFNLTENTQSNLSFASNHSIQDNLTYYLYLGNLRYNITTYGNGTTFNWSLTPTFTDETYGGLKNITLFAYNPTYSWLNITRNWSINISHANAPVVFNGSIASQQKNYDQVVALDLRGLFTDLDSNDTAYNQTLNFTALSNMSGSSGITSRVVNGSIILNLTSSLNMSFSATAEAFETFNITANDSSYANISNTFTIQFTTPTVVPSSSSTSSGGGGGGGGTSSQIKPVSLNIIVPGPVSARKQDKLIVPITLVNTGKVTLSGVTLRNMIAKNGILRSDLLASFDRSFIQDLLPEQKEELTLIVDVDTRETGLYEITLNGTSTTPSYSDTAKLYVNVKEGDTVAERISFTEEFVAENPECIEIKELIDEARALYFAGNTAAAEAKTEEALQACQSSISQKSRIQQRAANVVQQITDNLSITVIVALAVGIIYYWFRRLRMQHASVE